MTQDELLRVLLLRGHKARNHKNEVLVETCFFCGNPKWNLELNVNIGAYKCWNCNAKGGLGWLLKDQFNVTATFSTQRRRPPSEVEFRPDLSTQPLLVEPSPGMHTLLERRGLGQAEITRYGIRACVAKEPREFFLRVFFPLEDYHTRQSAGLLGRSLDGRRPKYLFTGTDRRIVGYRSRSKVHVCVEGVIDAIMVHKAGYNVAAMLGTMNKYITEWSALVPEKDPVVILLDGDALLEAERLYWQILPVHTNTMVAPLPEHLDPGMLSPMALKGVIERTLERGRILR